MKQFVLVNATYNVTVFAPNADVALAMFHNTYTDQQHDPPSVLDGTAEATITAGVATAPLPIADFQEAPDLTGIFN